MTSKGYAQQKMKCNIKGCENEAKHIEKPGMSFNTLCQKHFDEIYTGIIYEEGPNTDELVKSKYYHRATPEEKQARKES